MTRGEIIRKMYIITTGDYDNYIVYGYCTTKETAEQVCALRNAFAESGGRPSYPDYEYEEIDCLDSEIQYNYKIFYRYWFRIVRDSIKAEYRIDGIEHHYTVTRLSPPIILPKTIINEYTKQEYPKLSVGVTLEEDNVELAKEIAMDAFMRKVQSEEAVV